MRAVKRIFCAFTLLLLTASCGHAAELTVAAAADLAAPAREIAAGFEKQTGNTIRLTLGSSGNFFTQIESGAPFDVFLSADTSYPTKLGTEGFAAGGTYRVYAIGQLVLWAPAGTHVDLSKGMSALLDPTVHRIAIANPRFAPYGRAAVAAMQHFGVYDALRGKIIEGENISQAAQFVQSGNADAGLLAKSIVVASGLSARGQSWDVPEDAYPAIEQAAVVITSSHQSELANRFLDYVTGPAGRAVLARYGFRFPEPQK